MVGDQRETESNLFGPARCGHQIIGAVFFTGQSISEF
jgi:hypothetical protein